METDSVIEKAHEYLEKAYKLQMEGKYEEAADFYKISIELYPTPEAYTYLGWDYSFMGLLEEAIIECKKAIELDPDYGNPYNDIGSYLIQQGEYDEAITWLDMAINAPRYESYHYAHLNLGRAFELKGLWFEALAEYRTALEIEPKYELAEKLYYSLLAKMN